MKRSNCFVWAIRQRLRYGGRLIVRRSGVRFLPRFVWVTRDGKAFYYGPLHPKRAPWAFCHAIWFKGRVKRMW